MKKLMIAFAVVAMAACSQAANWRWSTTSAATIGPVLAMDSSSTLASATAYIFADGLQSAVYNKWYDEGKFDGGMLAGSLDDKSVANGAITTGSSYDFQTTDTGAKQNFFFAIIDANNNLYISATKGGTESALQGGTQLQFGAQAASKITYKNSTAYSAAGWYAAAAVPEPTSGLLLLLGVAGLALRRRRA